MWERWKIRNSKCLYLSFFPLPSFFLSLFFFFPSFLEILVVFRDINTMIYAGVFQLPSSCDFFFLPVTRALCNSLPREKGRRELKKLAASD